ncbi:hypothetical protein VCUG_00002 [Vavraia culicis subsp. floridensis]|uniref:F-box domain-containing protein n=1 Tax=Vavraia culicis (isolate floridensis) TaxID=948595 RepID=L2GYQ8_VAVCU|nr:uncharacterized protein VCUG_00002 [Vavraia culicis subsp. floridensis]ELA48393.1 hypothetical protein VCUG_00002 [Vavraia culicis subsp. floridensis]
MLNSACKYLNIEVQKGCIDVSKVEKLAKVVFFDCLPVCEGNLWIFSAKHKDCTDTSQKKRLELPNCIEDIVLEHVSVPKDTLLVVNEGCRNAAIIFSKGYFDLSNVKQLRKFKLLITEQSSISIEFPGLKNVVSLEISYDGNERYFMFLLLNCINVKEVILYNTVCELHDWIGRDTSTIPEKEMAPWELNELRAMINQESCTSRCRSPHVCFKDFNARCNPIFCWEKRKNIQNLSIIAFQISEECLKQLRKFISLKTLSIMAQNVRANIIYCLPFNLVNFSLMPIQCNAILERDVVESVQTVFGVVSSKRRHLKNLKLHYLFFIKIAWSMSLPEEVDVLEILPWQKIMNLNILVHKKIKVRKLVILKMNHATWATIYKIYEPEYYFSQLLCSLSQYIDFCSVKEIKILDQKVENSFDPCGYD